MPLPACFNGRLRPHLKALWGVSQNREALFRRFRSENNAMKTPHVPVRRGPARSQLSNFKPPIFKACQNLPKFAIMQNVSFISGVGVHANFVGLSQLARII